MGFGNVGWRIKAEESQTNLHKRRWRLGVLEWAYEEKEGEEEERAASMTWWHEVQDYMRGKYLWEDSRGSNVKFKNCWHFENANSSFISVMPKFWIVELHFQRVCGVFDGNQERSCVSHLSWGNRDRIHRSKIPMSIVTIVSMYYKNVRFTLNWQNFGKAISLTPDVSKRVSCTHCLGNSHWHLSYLGY